MKKLICFLILALCFPLSVLAADPYWVDDNGTETTWSNCQSASPMSGTSCCTLATANSNLAAGDTVYLRVGTYNISGSGINPTNTGTNGNVITFSAYNDEAVSFVGNGSTCRAVDLDSDYGTVRSYIKVHGITFTNFYRHMWIRKGDYNEISHCSFIGMYDTDIDWRGSTVYRGATYNHIHDCTFGDYGKYTPNDVGVIFALGNATANDDGTSYNLIEDSHFYHGGHHVFGMDGNHNVIRNNYIHNEAWSNYGGTDYGNRATFLVGYDNDDYRNLIENNRIAYAGECADSDIGGSGGTLASSYNIIRRNMYYQNGIYGFKFEYYPGNSNCLYNYVYNNTFWHNGWSTTGPLKDNWNNLYTHALYFDQEDATTQYNRIKNNIFYDNKNITNANEPIVKYPGGVPTQQTISNNWKGGVDGDPKFTSITGTPDPDNETQFDFTLQSDSGCIDAGTYLTQANGSGSGSTTLIVDDAGYFQDGWGIVNADHIAIGTVGNTAQISSINYDTNTITLASAMTWSDNAPVWLHKKSDGEVVLYGTAPDMGAHEILSPPRNLRIVH